MDTLRYSDESDRAYGATGAAIGLIIYDGECLLAGIDLDSEDPNDTVALSQEFYFAGNPGVSAKAAWNQMLKNYNLGISMLMANVMCRYVVNRRSAVPSDLLTFMRTLAASEGHDSCQLEDDEIERLFDKNYNYLSRVFAHRGVQSVAHDFASALMSRRSLSPHEALELLSALNML